MDQPEECCDDNVKFSDRDKIRCLLWCARHCCLCGEFRAIGIELAHIDPKRKPKSGTGDIDNAIPVCPNCHAELDAISEGHGTKYKPEETKARRDQVYEEHTRHLVPPIAFEPTQDAGKPFVATDEKGNIVKDDNGNPVILQPQVKLPEVRAEMKHLSDCLPVRVLLELRICFKGEDLGPPEAPIYSGKRTWNMNPREGFSGHFDLTEANRKTKKLKIDETTNCLKILARLVVLDQYERPHALLPKEWNYKYDEKLRIGQWVVEPSPAIEVKEWQRPMRISEFLPENLVGT